MAFLFHVLEPLLEQPDDVLVVERIEHHAAGAPGAHDAHAAQEAQLMRDGGLAEAEQTRQIADAQLGTGQGVEHPHARGVAEQLEGVGERRRGRVGQQTPPERGDLRRVEVKHVAVIGDRSRHDVND